MVELSLVHGGSCSILLHCTYPVDEWCELDARPPGVVHKLQGGVLRSQVVVVCAELADYDELQPKAYSIGTHTMLQGYQPNGPRRPTEVALPATACSHHLQHNSSGPGEVDTPFHQAPSR